jgi:hypothetical protein
VDGFADSYQDARRAFRAAVGRLGGRLSSAPVPGVGADGEGLTIDWAVIGRPDRPKTLLSISGVHGAEGHAGSAAQRAFLADLDPATLGDDCNIVMVHALNPWGLSHGFRVDADNIDLSRNFGDFAAPPRANPHYAGVHATVCPDGWDDGLLDRAKALHGRLTRDLGAAAALTAFTGGQHSHPDGIGFGGRGPSASRLIFERIVAETLPACARLAYLEWHTGFGAYGRPLAVSLDAPGDPARARLAGWWAEQDPQTEDEAFESGEVPDWSGLLLPGLRGLAPHLEITGAPIEIGTVSNFEAFEAVMIDRWLRLGRDPGEASTRARLKRRLRDAYDPPDPRWRSQVAAAGRAMHASALAGLRRW